MFYQLIRRFVGEKRGRLNDHEDVISPHIEALKWLKIDYLPIIFTRIKVLKRASS